MTGPKPTLAGICEQLNKRRGAVAYVQRLRREAQAVKRTYGQPRNPFAAVPGMEAEFKEADRAARYCDFLLKEIEKKPRRKRETSSFINAVTRRLLDYLVILGLLTFIAFGIALMVWSTAAALGPLLGVSLPRWAVALVILGLVVLVAAGAELWKRRKPPGKRTASNEKTPYYPGKPGPSGYTAETLTSQAALERHLREHKRQYRETQTMLKHLANGVPDKLEIDRG